MKMTEENRNRLIRYANGITDSVSREDVAIALKKIDSMHESNHALRCNNHRKQADMELLCKVMREEKDNEL